MVTAGQLVRRFEELGSWSANLRRQYILCIQTKLNVLKLAEDIKKLPITSSKEANSKCDHILDPKAQEKPYIQNLHFTNEMVLLIMRGKDKVVFFF